MNTEKGEFFGAMNLPVHYWLLERKHNGLPSLKEVDTFCVVNEELFNEYDSFKTSYNKSYVELLLPFNDLVIHYMEKNKIPIRCVDMFQQRFIDFPPNRIDDICEWIEEAREKFHNIGFGVFH